MSLIRESLKKVQEDDPNNKATAALLSVPLAGEARKKPSRIVLLLGIGLVLLSGAVYLLYGPGRSKPAVPIAASVPNPVSVAQGPSSSLPAASTQPEGGPSQPVSQGLPAPPAAVSTLKRSVPKVGSLSGKEKTGSAPRAKASSREVPDATRTGAGELQDSGGREALKKSYQQAYGWQQEGRTNQALARYREILAQDPYNPYVLTNLGLIYQQTGNLKEAISYYEKAIEADPGFVPATQNLGLAWLKAGNSEDAARWLERSLALEPDNAPALVNLGILYKKRGNREMARHYFKKAWALNTRLPEASYNLARLEEEAGNIPEAWKYYQQFIRLRNNPNDTLVQEVQRHVQDWRVPETVQR